MDDATTRQRQAADPQRSVWVGASAGTGKTKVLTDRVVRLMLAGTDPARILCLTFTKAAAAEMANRINQRLASWAVAGDDDLARSLAELNGRPPTPLETVAARRLFARVLDAAGGMKIQTIHAFCQSLLRRFPLEAGLPANFEVMDDRSAGEALAEAQAGVLAAARGDPDGALGQAVRRLTGALNEEDFASLLRELVMEQGRLRRILEHHGGLDGTLHAIRRQLQLTPQDSEASLLAAACADGAFAEGDLRAACAALAQGTGKTDAPRGQALQRWLDHPDQRRPLFADYEAIFLTREGEVRKILATAGARKANPRVDEILATEAQRLAAVKDRLRAAAVAEATTALLHLADAMLAAYLRRKNAHALLDFDDLILTAGALLSGRRDACAWVLYKLDGGLDHILIDEAQDTNPDQWAVVSALANEFFVGEGTRAADGPSGPRTLFVVGDEKQSIYSFQRADPAEFARMRLEFHQRITAAGQRFDRIDLETSFRSVAAVLRAVDAVFGQDDARDGVVLDPGATIQHVPFRKGMAGRVEVWPLITPDAAVEPTPWAPPVDHEQADDPAARLATTIAAQIARWLETGARLDSQDRPIVAGDVLVLVRRRNAFVPQLVRALKERGVPVAGVDRMVLTEQLAVMDLVAVARFLLMPEDDLTLATVLKGPFLGLSEEQLFAVAHKRTGSLWQALARKADADAAFRPAYDWLRDLAGRVDYGTPFSLFASLLARPCPADGGGARRALLGRLGPDANDPVDEFLTLSLGYTRNHVPSLEGFLHWLAAGRTEVKRELETGGGAVRIMTVHGSKGLQAPIVILPDSTGVPDKSPRILWPDAAALEAAGRDASGGHGGTGGRRTVPLYAPRRALEEAHCRSARSDADRRRDQEYRRLLYVALTRAEDRLYVCGWEGRRATSDHSWYRLTERALGGADGGTDGMAEKVDFHLPVGEDGGGLSGPGLRLEEAQSVPPAASSRPSAESAATPAARPLPAWAREKPAAEAIPSRPLTPSHPVVEEPAVRSPMGDDDGQRFRRGNLVHTLLQWLPDMPAAERRGVTERWLARPAQGLTPAEQRAIADETLAVLDHPDFAPLFGPDSRAEVPLVGRVPELPGFAPRTRTDQVLSAQIDRLLVTDREVVIVDFKTNRPPPQRADDVPLAYVMQMAAYRAALQAIYPDRPVRGLMLWTDGPHITELSAAQMDAALQRW